MKSLIFLIVGWVCVIINWTVTLDRLLEIVVASVGLVCFGLFFWFEYGYREKRGRNGKRQS